MPVAVQQDAPLTPDDQRLETAINLTPPSQPRTTITTYTHRNRLWRDKPRLKLPATVVQLFDIGAGCSAQRVIGGALCLNNPNAALRPFQPFLEAGFTLAVRTDLVDHAGQADNPPPAAHTTASAPMRRTGGSSAP